MGGEGSCRTVVGLLVAIAIAATGCSRASMPPRDASAAHVAADGVAESQPADTASAPAATAAATASDDNYGSDPGRDPHHMRRVLGWISLSIGAEAAVLAAVTSALIVHQKGVRDDNCNTQKVCNPAGINAVNTIDSIVPWNTASWFVAAAGLGAGAVLVISSPKTARRTAITLSPNSSGLGLGVRSTF
jgi:hypothetical protein